MRHNKLKISAITLMLAVTFALTTTPATAQSRFGRIMSGLLKAGTAATITDEEMAEMVHEEVMEMDRKNTVCPATSAYTKRLTDLTKGMTEANGITLNFKVYKTTDYNAFACPDGSVRVFSALMDVLSDDELLGVIEHEIGHVALKHSKKAWRSALLRSAASDAIGAMSSTWAAFSDTFVGDVCGEALSAKNSRYHESQADDFAYDFLKKHGKNPWAMGLALKKLKQLSKQPRYAKWLQAFSTHPEFDKRIEHIRSRAKADGYNPK